MSWFEALTNIVTGGVFIVAIIAGAALFSCVMILPCAWFSNRFGAPLERRLGSALAVAIVIAVCSIWILLMLTTGYWVLANLPPS